MLPAPSGIPGGGRPSPVCRSCTSDFDDVRQLLAMGSSVNSMDQGGGRSALDWACANGDTALATLLVRSGGDVNHASGDYGVDGRQLTRYNTWTPLHLAAEACNKEVVTMLLGAGASVNGPSSCTPTPLSIASRHHRFAAGLDIVSALTRHGGRL